MKNRFLLTVIIGLALLLATLWIKNASAQEDSQWSPPYRRSTEKREASEAALVADQYGYVHVFWAEVLEDDSSLLMYARYDGKAWSIPIDIHVVGPFSPIGNVSPVVDKQGTLHIMWVEGQNGPIYYMSAPAHIAFLSVQYWQRPYRLPNVHTNRVQLQIDSKGIFHVIHAPTTGPDSGVYYIRSEDGGETWSDPIWLDPDILPDYKPRSLNFEVDESDGLHAAWYYVPDESTGGDWVRYTHSLDGGHTWSQPFTIDKLEEGIDDGEKTLSAAGPVMAVQGQNVHIIWAGGKLHYRHHRFSTDRGETWSVDRRIFGELNGQAFDGLAVDASGRVHFLRQIRFPMAIYHAVWNGEQWTEPTLLYLIRYNSTDPPGSQIQAHYTHPAIRTGNQLVLTLTDSPSAPERRLFVMERSLEDVSPVAPISTPTPTLTPTPNASSTPLPTATVTVPSFEGLPPPTSTPAPGYGLWSAVVSTLFITGGVVVFRLLRLKH